MPTTGAEAQEFLLNVGPQHPSTHGVLRVIVQLEGERMVAATPVLGYLHRCIEKLAEQLSYHQVVALVDRADYASAITNEWAFCRATEHLAGIEVPERAEYIRVIVGELQRLNSHLLAVGAYAHDFDALSAFIYALIERESAMDLFELLSGGRLMYNFFRLGGVHRDLPEGFQLQVKAFLERIRRLCDETDRLVLQNGIFIERTRGIGRLTREDALRMGATGPVLRSSGVDWDLRKNQPYSVYDRFDFDVPVGKVGDCFERAALRVEEMRQSCRIIEQALATLPAGEVRAKVPAVLRPPAGSLYAAIEGPRGEVGAYLVSDGGSKPYRLKWQAPSYNNLGIVPLVSPGHRLADLMAVLGSIDIILGEVER